ncbi:jg8299 [Pararge aegeria aegeria]|uniref:Jg8299 protein n=1 Tax=Pararge aegeria aegeria TaxID=348720 RepID=A0A8S4R8H5_9NEOP|nr:jg8299 [Pararge aegeria aegeria]
MKPHNDGVAAGSPVTSIACDARWACVACVDGSLHVWTLSKVNAQRALPPIALTSQAAKLTLSGDTLAVVTTSATLAIWDLANASCVIRPLCFRNLLTHGGTEDQLRNILDDLLGPSHCTSTPKIWQNTILGIRKHDLLEEMLSLLVRQLRWQRLYTEYQDQLSSLKQTSAMVNGH